MKLIQTYRATLRQYTDDESLLPEQLNFELGNLTDWLQRLVGTIAEVENQREIGGSNNPAFENSWANVAGEAAVAFYKDPYQRVHIKGAVDTGANGTTIFTLPTGYRPTEKLVFVTSKLTGVIGLITIDTDGTVDSSVGNTNGVTINISFRV